MMFDSCFSLLLCMSGAIFDQMHGLIVIIMMILLFPSACCGKQESNIRKISLFCPELIVNMDCQLAINGKCLIVIWRLGKKDESQWRKRKSNNSATQSFSSNQYVYLHYWEIQTRFRDENGYAGEEVFPTCHSVQVMREQARDEQRKGGGGLRGEVWQVWEKK